jgi:hypothetical protein
MQYAHEPAVVWGHFVIIITPSEAITTVIADLFTLTK